MVPWTWLRSIVYLFILLTLFTDCSGKSASFGEIVSSGSGETDVHPSDFDGPPREFNDGHIFQDSVSKGRDWKDSESGDFDIDSYEVKSTPITKASMTPLNTHIQEKNLPIQTRPLPTTEKPLKKTTKEFSIITFDFTSETDIDTTDTTDSASEVNIDTTVNTSEVNIDTTDNTSEVNIETTDSTSEVNIETTDSTSEVETEITFSPEEEATAFTPVSMDKEKPAKDINLGISITTVSPNASSPTKPTANKQSETSLAGEIVKVVIIAGAVIIIVGVITALVILPKIRKKFMSVPTSEPKEDTKIPPEETFFLVEEKNLNKTKETPNC